MRENQIFAAGVQVEARPELLHRHHRALYVPARTPRPNRRIPRGFARLRSLPEGEVAGAVLFVLVDVDARAVGHARKIFLRELAVCGEFRDAEIVRAVVGAVSETFLYQFGNEVSYRIDVFG